MHHPCTAAIVGFEQSWSFAHVAANEPIMCWSRTESHTRSSRSTSSACASVDQSRSYPAQNAGPSASRRMTRTSASRSASAIAAATSSRSCGVMVL